MILLTLVTGSPTPRLGVLGCGHIAEILARHNLDIEVVAVYDRHSERAECLASTWGARVCQNFAEFIGHEILVTGEFGEIEIKITNLPSPENPATSYLAALSLITLLNDLGNVLQIGT